LLEFGDCGQGPQTGRRACGQLPRPVGDGFREVFGRGLKRIGIPVNQRAEQLTIAFPVKRKIALLDARDHDGCGIRLHTAHRVLNRRDGLGIHLFEIKAGF